MDNTGLVGGHLHVGEVIPSGEMNARPARHLLRSVFPLQLLIPCSFHAFAVLERLSAARVASKSSALYVFSLLNGALESCVEAAAIAAVLADRGGTRGVAINTPLMSLRVRSRRLAGPRKGKEAAGVSRPRPQELHVHRTPRSRTSRMFMRSRGAAQACRLRTHIDVRTKSAMRA